MKFINIKELSTGTSLLSRRARQFQLRGQCRVGVGGGCGGNHCGQSGPGGRCGQRVTAGVTRAFVLGMPPSLAALSNLHLPRPTACFNRDYHSGPDT
ncbi:MAG: hypothetical protein [Olavius algarvensis Gamma 1 endosymbiont]|nr:MAG: hypothetical protein [Olavius algarvensis Gamma 1 endosymbiont]